MHNLRCSSSNIWTKCRIYWDLFLKLKEANEEVERLSEPMQALPEEGTRLHSLLESWINEDISKKELLKEEPLFLNLINLLEKYKRSYPIAAEVKVFTSVVDPLGFKHVVEGTADVVVGTKENLVMVLDLKTGFKDVHSYNNTQLTYYAKGLLEQYDCLDGVTMAVYNLRSKKYFTSSYVSPPKRLYKKDLTTIIGEHCTYCPFSLKCSAQQKFFKLLSKQKYTDVDMNKFLASKATVQRRVQLLTEQAKENVPDQYILKQVPRVKFVPNENFFELNPSYKRALPSQIKKGDLGNLAPNSVHKEISMANSFVKK